MKTKRALRFRVRVRNLMVCLLFVGMTAGAVGLGGYLAEKAGPRTAAAANPLPQANIGDLLNNLR